jgi:hypothetical protein
MKLPDNTANLIKEYTALVETRKFHDLNPYEWFSLYLSFGPSLRKKLAGYQSKYLILSPADKTVAWLGILCARKVLPIWEEIASQPLKECGEQESYNPVEMLETAEQVLNGEIDEYEAQHVRLAHRFYYGTLGLENVTTAEVFHVINAAYKALGATIIGWNQTELYIWGVAKPSVVNDFVVPAVRAYSWKDLNPPGVWAKLAFNHNDPSVNYQPLKNDLNKRLDFWQWWLTEAIPQAWELGHQSS